MHLVDAFFGQGPVTIFLVTGSASFDSDPVAEDIDFHQISFLSEPTTFLIDRTACSILRRSFRRPFSGFTLIASNVSFIRESVAFAEREFFVFAGAWLSFRKSIS